MRALARFVASLLIGSVALLAVPATCAAADAASGRVAVDVVAAPGAEDWFAAALQDTLVRELSRFQRVTLAPALDRSTCPHRESACLIDAYGKAGVDVVVVGTLDTTRLRFDTYETWSGSIVSDGSVPVAGVTDNLDRLKAQLGRIVRPIVANGGAIDRKPLAAAGPEMPPPKPRPPVVLLVLAGLLLFLASPPILLLGLVPRKALAGRKRPASLVPTLWLVAAVAGLIAIEAVPAARGAAASIVPFLARVAAVMGGLLWGWFLLLNARIAFPRLHGIERVHQEAIRPLFGAWLRTAAFRVLALLAAYAPAWVVARVLGAGLGLYVRASDALLFPALGLACCFWLLALVDHLAIHLDVALVEGTAGASNAWHRTMSRYLRGYVRRGGVDLPPGVLERVLLLPSRAAGVTCWGGGFAAPRISVSRTAYELALGPLPDEEELPERTSNPEELPLGYILPGNKSGPLAESIRRRASAAPSRPRALLPRAIGAAATLLGWVLPQKAEKGMPLVSDSTEDFEVVRSLLTMHYAGFEKNLRDDEYDDSDPTQKDFLFGALLREIGRVMRHDSLIETLRLSVALQWDRMSAASRAVLGRAAELHRRFLSGDPARISDAWAALNGGRDPLIQHLFLEWDPEAGEKGLTVRGDSPKLFRRSKQLADAAASRTAKGADAQPGRATLRNRILWLAELLRTPLFDPAETRALFRRRVAVTAVLLLAAGGLAVHSAVAYHPIYEARMRDAEAKAAAAANPDAPQPGEPNGRGSQSDHP